MNTTSSSQSNGGWVKLYRKTPDWEWWTEPLTAHLFIHCLMKSNRATRTWRGITIERGSFITSIAKLSTESGLTIQQTRTAIEHLQSTGEITSQSTNKYTTITICNYDEYQDTTEEEQQTDKQTNQHADNKQTTSNQQTNNKQLTTNKNIENERMRENNNLSLTSSNAGARIVKIENFDFEEGKGEADAQASQQAPTPQPPAPGEATTTKPAPTPYGSTYADTETLYAAYRKELTTETMTSDAALRLAKGYGHALTREQLGEYLDRFQDTRRASGDTHTTHSDYRRHFTNWLRITIEIENKQKTENQQRRTTNGNNNQTDNRPRQIADAAEFTLRL